MNVGLISSRYARALYDFSVNAGEEGVVYEELKALLSHLNKMPEFAEALSSPIFTQERKLLLLEKAAGKNLSDSLQRFFRLLTKHRREDILADICHSYKLTYDKEKGIIWVKLITAVPVEKDKIDQILNKLEVGSGKKIELTHIVQQDIIGGYILITDGKRLDASIKTRLMNIRKTLTI